MKQACLQSLIEYPIDFGKHVLPRDRMKATALMHCVIGQVVDDALVWMSWVLLSLISAVFLGIYDLLKKASLRDNAVPPVLFVSVAVPAFVWMPFWIWSRIHAQSIPLPFLFVQPMSSFDHGLILIKSALVSASWTLAYFAVKHLPVTLASPIRATAPVWTILVAVLIMGERPSWRQWMGMVVILAAFYAISVVGRLEGIQFRKNRWVGYMVMATLLGASSGLYDKWLFQSRAMDPSTVQCWFSIYLTVVLAPFYLLWKRGAIGSRTFQWRWTIPLIGLTLLAADLLYFNAISQEDALISVISPLRRTSVMVTLAGGAWLFREKNPRLKAWCLIALLIGVFLLKMK